MIKELYQHSKGLDILFVEDDDELRNQMQDMFNELFNSVDIAENGKLGLAQYTKYKEDNNKPYDLVITDINMPEMNGIEMIHAIYETDPLQPIIVVSAHNESDYLMDLLCVGINSFLIKPVKHAELINTLYKATKNIINERLVKAHYQEVEELNKRLSIQSEELKKSNEAMREKNIALEKSMRIIEGMQHKDNMQRHIHIPAKSSGTFLEKEEGLESTLKSPQSYLEDIEDMISNIAQEYTYKKIEDTSLQELSAAVKGYTDVLPKEKRYERLAQALKSLATTLASRPKCNSREELDRILSMLECFFFIYTKWQHEWKNIESDKFEQFCEPIKEEINVLIDVWNCKV